MVEKINAKSYCPSEWLALCAAEHLDAIPVNTRSRSQQQKKTYLYEGQWVILIHHQTTRLYRAFRYILRDRYAAHDLVATAKVFLTRKEAKNPQMR